MNVAELVKLTYYFAASVCLFSETKLGLVLAGLVVISSLCFEDYMKYLMFNLFGLGRATSCVTDSISCLCSPYVS